MQSHDAPPELLTLDEVAKKLRLSPATTSRLVSAGVLPTIAVSDRRRVVSAQDLDNYLAQRRAPRSTT